MIKKTRTYHITDVDCYVLIHIASSQKDVFGYLDEYIENLGFEWFDPTDDSFEILYKDGTLDFIDSDYDGHKIRRKDIKSMVCNNASDSIVYGQYTVNEFGIVHVAHDNNKQG